MKTTVCSTLVLGMIGSMLAGCGGSASDATDSTASLKQSIKSVPSCGPVWQTGGTYTAGEVVLYKGAFYTALVNQTDYAGTGWNPTVPTLYSATAACSAPTPTPPPCPPTWSPKTAYTAGQEVLGSDGMVFVANWWTEGIDPAMNNYGPPGSGEPWSWTGTFCGGATSGPIPTPVPPPTPAPIPTPTPA